ncbi:MAG: AMP-binding protein [Bacteroidales bacterium]|nr:AMP-binding protein [Bacteroidales bacterium]
MNTIIDFFEESVKNFGDNIYMWEKSDGHYKGSTYKEIHEKVLLFGAGLMSLGVQKGDRIGLVADGRNSWIISELGILYAGAADVPMSIRLSSDEIKFRLEHSSASMVIVSKQQVPKVKGMIGSMNNLKKIIHLDPAEDIGDSQIMYDEILELGKVYLENNKAEFDERWQSVQENDMANVTYTSGTTADPKGIILSQLNYLTNVKQIYTLIEFPQDFRILLMLPWDHAFAHTCGLYGFMGRGASIASVEIGSTPLETLKNIPKNIREIKPHMLMSVPAYAKNFRKNIEKGIREKGPFIEKLFNHALKLSYSYNRDGFNKAKGIHKLKLPLIKLYDKIIFKKIRDGFGGDLEYFIGGGALLDIELQRFFYAIGIPMYQAYGLTEAAPAISSNTATRHKLGSSGYLVKYLDLKICDEDGKELPVGEKGEIIVKGDNIMLGYWDNEEATKETIKDGWLHTGDMGYMDKDGFLYVLGRFKSLLISDDGEKYSPEGIEEAITDQSKYIEQCTLFNDQKPYTVALVFPNNEAVGRWLAENNLGSDTDEGQKAVANLIKSEINKYKKGQEFEDMFPQRWLPSAIGILSEGYTAENHLLNSVMKMVRGKIADKYQDLLEFLYTPAAKEITNNQNIEAIKKLF